MKELTQIDAWLAPGEQHRLWLDPVFRVATSLIFIVGGIGHFAAHDYMLERMAESPWRDMVAMIGDPSWLLWLSGAVFVAFGITLALGFLTRISALVILVTLIPITVAVHVAPGHAGPLFKNIAIMGALLYFYANGPGRFAIDRQSKIRALHGAMESVGHIFMPAWGSSVATGVGVGRGAVFVGAALAAGFLGEGEAFGAEGAAAAFAGSGALEAIGIGSPASIASIIEIYRAWTVLTFCAAVQTPPVDPLARTTSSSAIAPR